MIIETTKLLCSAIVAYKHRPVLYIQGGPKK